MMRCRFDGIAPSGRMHFTTFLPLREGSSPIFDAHAIDGDWPVIGRWDGFVGGLLSFDDVAGNVVVEWTDSDRTTIDLRDGCPLIEGSSFLVHSARYPTVVTTRLTAVERFCGRGP